MSFVLRLAASQQTPYFVLCGSIEKHTQGVVPVSQKVLGTSSDYDTISGFGRSQHDALGHLQNAFAIDNIQLVGIDAAFITASQKGPEEAGSRGDPCVPPGPQRPL